MVLRYKMCILVNCAPVLQSSGAAGICKVAAQVSCFNTGICCHLRWPTEHPATPAAGWVSLAPVPHLP